MNSKTQLRLVGITDAKSAGWRATVDACSDGIQAGLPALMIRDHETSLELILPHAREIQNIARAHHTLVIVNRRLELAESIQSDGIHLGATGPTITEVREVFGKSIQVGYSAHEEAEALRAFEQGANYVIFSPIFETPSKVGILRPMGLERLRELCEQAPGPVIALGGINTRNAKDVLGAGAQGIAAIRAVFEGDTAQNVRQLLAIIDQVV